MGELMILDLSGTSKRFLPDKSSIISCDKDFWISHGNPEVEHSSQSKTDFRVPEKSSLSPPWWVLSGILLSDRPALKEKN